MTVDKMKNNKKSNANKVITKNNKHLISTSAFDNTGEEVARVHYFTPPPSNNSNNATLHSTEPTKAERKKIEELLLKKDYLNKEEKECVVHWNQRNMINSPYYHLNFLLNEEKFTSNFKPNTEEDTKLLTDYHNRELGNSPYHTIWIIQY